MFRHLNFPHPHSHQKRLDTPAAFISTAYCTMLSVESESAIGKMQQLQLQSWCIAIATCGEKKQTAATDTVLGF
jgi:hypothetical protein